MTYRDAARIILVAVSTSPRTHERNPRLLGPRLNLNSESRVTITENHRQSSSTFKYPVLQMPIVALNVRHCGVDGKFSRHRPIEHV